jgi:hypothetical protein
MVLMVLYLKAGRWATDWMPANFISRLHHPALCSLSALLFAAGVPRSSPCALLAATTYQQGRAHAQPLVLVPTYRLVEAPSMM